MEQPERWRPIAGFPDYEVSDHGRVRRITASMGATVGKVLRPGRHPHGHQFVSLSAPDKKKYSRRVHRLVAVAFIGECPPNQEVNHKDFDPGNNHWTNLEYLTHADNNRHSARAGRMRPPRKAGEAAHSAKLTEAQIREIRRRYAAGERPGVIGKDFGIVQSYVWAIAKRKAWADVE